MKFIFGFVFMFISYSTGSAKESCLNEKSKFENTKYFSCELADGSKGTQIHVDGINSYIIYGGKKLKCTTPMPGMSKLVIMNCMNNLNSLTDLSGFKTIVLDRDEGVLKTHYAGSPKISGMVFEEKCIRQTISSGNSSSRPNADKVDSRK